MGFLEVLGKSVDLPDELFRMDDALNVVNQSVYPISTVCGLNQERETVTVDAKRCVIVVCPKLSVYNV